MLIYFVKSSVIINLILHRLILHRRLILFAQSEERFLLFYLFFLCGCERNKFRVSFRLRLTDRKIGSTGTRGIFLFQLRRELAKDTHARRQRPVKLLIVA